jgi:hypothetical protein
MTGNGAHIGVLMPIYFSPGEAWWREAANEAVLLGELSRLARMGDAEGLGDLVGLPAPLVVTDEAGLARKLREAGLAVLDGPSPSPESPSLLPLGSRAALRALAPDRDARLLLLDFRRLAAAAEDCRALLRAAGEAGMDAAGVWTTVLQPRDHPCQLRRHMTVRDTGFLHLLDPAPELLRRGYRASLPYQAMHGFAHAPAGTCFRPELAPAGEPLRHGEEADILLRSSGDGAARCLVSEQRLARMARRLRLPSEARITGFACEPLFPRDALLFERDGQTWLLVEALPDDAEETGALASIQNRDHYHEHVCATGIPCRLPVSALGSGIPLCVVNEGAQGSAPALSIPFQESLGLWSMDSDGEMRNLTEGTRISGRQTFPECYLVEAAATLGRAEDLARFDALLAEGGVSGVPVSEERLLIRNRLDLLRHRVARPARLPAEAKEATCP